MPGLQHGRPDVHRQAIRWPAAALVRNNGGMSIPPLGTTAARDQGRTLPSGEVIGRYSSYLDAQKAVDYLADNKFAVQRVAIVGSDLRTVERVTGRLSYPRVALGSAATGAWFGLFVGLILSLFGGSEAGSTIMSSIALGAVFWLLFGVITYAFQRGKRDFTSTSQVIATNYDVIVEPSSAGEARRLLQGLPMNGQAQHPGPAGGQTAPEQQQRPDSPAPERPAGWTDPYAGSPGTGDQPGSPEAQTAGLGTTGPRRGQFPDLPDGRPQYGVRVAEQPAEQAAGQTTEQAGGQNEPAPQDVDGSAGQQERHGSSSVDGPSGR